MLFHASTFAGSKGCCLNTRPIGRVIKHLPRDPASVNAMKQTCVIVILAYFIIPTKLALKTLLNIKVSIFLHWISQTKCPFSYTGILKQNGVGCVLSNVITSPQRHNRTQRFREQKHRRNDQPGPQRFPYITSCK